jgi:hypothetical protein
VETVALNSLGIEASWNRQQFGHARHGLMKRRVKAGQLRQFWMTMAECFYQFNLARQMIRIVRTDAMEFIQQVFGNDLRRDVFHPMNHPMSHRFDRRKIRSGFKPVYQEISSRSVIGSGKFAALRPFLRRFIERQICPAQADAVNFSVESTF